MIIDGKAFSILQRLRTENRLLRQRVDNLEKETGTLADRLVSDQVTRAQEAEEMFAVRRELSALKTQNEGFMLGLEEANYVIRQLKQQVCGLFFINMI
jgi:predicted RNase H-like nuclease (RuvC/YqgF family)